MWLERREKKLSFLQILPHLKEEILLVRGARQVGKTAFILNALEECDLAPKIFLNLANFRSTQLDGVHYWGREFFGNDNNAAVLIDNIGLHFGPLASWKKPGVLFVDEADRHLPAMEAIQSLAQYHQTLKVVFTGSNLENVEVHNAGTGRKRYLDLYPLTFPEFLQAGKLDSALNVLSAISLEQMEVSEHFHALLRDQWEIFLRIGGMPKVVSTFFENPLLIPEIISSLVPSIEDNVKAILGEKAKLYEYSDILRTLAYHSLNTLRFSSLQVNHAGRTEAQRLVQKTVGARVAHKIRLQHEGKDHLKYILFDSGVLNYLLNGSQLLTQKIPSQERAILLENLIGIQMISGLVSRDELYYWKSPRGAEVEFLLRHPQYFGVDVKTNRGDTKSLSACALLVPELDILIKIHDHFPKLIANFEATLPTFTEKRKIPLLQIPHYLSSEILRLLR